jgi:hypothetical protein
LGQFKLESYGDKAVALCPTLYCLEKQNQTNLEDRFKFSCKGIQKEANNISYKKFENVLFNKTHDMAVNQGFRYVNGCMNTYEQSKKGLSYIYNKRILLSDGISTKPLNI